MKKDLGLCYRSARKASGLTQDRWAEFLGVSAEAVRGYESGTYFPSDDVLVRMTDISGLAVLPYWHLQQKSRVAAEILPDLEDGKTIPEAVLGLLIQIDDFRDDGMKELIRIAADGKVSDDEEEIYQSAMHQLQDLIRRAYELGYAKETP